MLSVSKNTHAWRRVQKGLTLALEVSLERCRRLSSAGRVTFTKGGYQTLILSFEVQAPSAKDCTHHRVSPN